MKDLLLSDSSRTDLANRAEELAARCAERSGELLGIDQHLIDAREHLANYDRKVASFTASCRLTAEGKNEAERNARVSIMVDDAFPTNGRSLLERQAAQLHADREFTERLYKIDRALLDFYAGFAGGAK